MDELIKANEEALLKLLQAINQLNPGDAVAQTASACNSLALTLATLNAIQKSK